MKPTITIAVDAVWTGVRFGLDGPPSGFFGIWVGGSRAESAARQEARADAVIALDELTEYGREDEWS